MEENRFSKRIKVTSEILSKIAKVDEFKGLWRGSTGLNPQILNRLKSTVIITSTGASTRIEGSRLSDEDVDKFVRGLSIQKFTDRDKQEVKGYYELLENIFKEPILSIASLEALTPEAVKGRCIFSKML